MSEQYENYRARFDGAGISTYVAMCILVPLRVWSRAKLAGTGIQGIGMDDWILMASFALAHLFFWLIMIYIRPLIGQQYEDLPHGYESLQLFLKMLVVFGVLYPVIITITKLSVLSFYYRVFATALRWPIFILASLCVGWVISIALIALLMCRPIEASWTPELMATAKCIDPEDVYLGGSIPNVLLDFAVILLPMPLIMRLNLPIVQRLAVASMFALGLFICIVSAVRLSALVSIENMNNPTYDLRNMYLWTLVEINVGIISACLPGMRPLMRIVGLGRLFGVSSGRMSGGNGNTPGVGDESSSAIAANRTIGTIGTAGRKAPRQGFFTVLASTLSRPDSGDDEIEMIDNKITISRQVHVESGELGGAAYGTDDERSEKRNEAA